jgi:hypothetical protein
MFFLHLLLFYLLVPSILSDEGAHWKQVLKNVAFKNKKNKWYWLPPQVSKILLIFNQAFVYLTMPQAKPKGEIVCLNNVIGMDSNGEIMLYNLLDDDSPRKINSVGVVIEPTTLLWRLDGIWHLIPDVSGMVYFDFTTVLLGFAGFQLQLQTPSKGVDHHCSK